MESWKIIEFEKNNRTTWKIQINNMGVWIIMTYMVCEAARYDLGSPEVPSPPSISVSLKLIELNIVTFIICVFTA